MQDLLADGKNALNIESAAVFARYLEVPVSAFSKRLAQQIKEISRSNASNLGEATQPVEAFRYPVITWVAAGAAETAESLPTDDSGTYQTSEYDSTGPAFWLQVRGDSMASPSGMSINEGTSILVDTAIEAAPGRLVVAKFPDSNETTFRMLVSDGGKLYLKPLNQDYPVESFGEERPDYWCGGSGDAEISLIGMESLVSHCGKSSIALTSFKLRKTYVRAGLSSASSS